MIQVLTVILHFISDNMLAILAGAFGLFWVAVLFIDRQERRELR